MALTMRSAGLRAAAPARLSRRAIAVRVRAAGEEPAAPAAPATPAAEPIASVAVPPPTAAAPAAAAVAKTVSFGDAMAFANPSGPETINGRLAMLAVTSAIAAELASGESVLTQLHDATPAVLITGALIAVGSLIPLMKGADPTAAFGPLTHTAEMANGRAAMLGLAALLVIELTKGSALF